MRRSRCWWWSACAALWVIVAGSGSARAAIEYTLTDLQTLGGISAQAFAVNNSGTIVGSARDSNGDVRPFIWSAGTMSDLGKFTGGGATGSAYGINSTGESTGEHSASTGSRAFRHDGTSMTNLGLLAGEDSFGYAINDSGVVVGEADAANGINYRGVAFIYSGAGPMTSLGTLPGGDGGSSSGSAARDINNAGTIVGYSDTSSGNTHAFIRIGSTMTDIHLGLPSWGWSYAHAISETGTVAGAANNASGYFHASRYSGGTTGTWTDLGDLTTLQQGYSEAYAINTAGDIVGTSDSNAGVTHAFLYRSGSMVDLNDLVAPGSGLTLRTARGINDLGWIVGRATDGLGNNRAFLLVPIPEPSAVLALVPASLLLRRGRRS